MKLRPPLNFPIVLANVANVDERVLKAGETGIRKGLEFAKTISMREFLRGPRPAKLGEVTGRLRDSLTVSVTRTGKGVVGRIGSNVKYARFHEFGLTGVVNVREHTRHIQQKLAGNSSRRVKFIRDPRTGSIIATKRESVNSAAKRGVEFMEQTVKAHPRKVDYKGRPFIRPALERAQAIIRETIVLALKQGTE